MILYSFIYVLNFFGDECFYNFRKTYDTLENIDEGPDISISCEYRCATATTSSSEIYLQERTATLKHKHTMTLAQRQYILVEKDRPNQNM